MSKKLLRSCLISRDKIPVQDILRYREFRFQIMTKDFFMETLPHLFSGRSAVTCIPSLFYLDTGSIFGRIKSCSVAQVEKSVRLFQRAYCDA